MKGGNLYKEKFNETAAVRSTFQRRICQLLKTIVLSSAEKHGKTKHGDLLQKKNKRSNDEDIKTKVLG